MLKSPSRWPTGWAQTVGWTRAADAGAAPRTVGRALARLAGLGMVRWIRRLIRVGDCVQQTSNSYALIKEILTDGHFGHGTLSKALFSAAATTAHVAKNAMNKMLTALTSPDRDVLAAVRTKRERALGLRV